jgi:hypothetical protein
LIFTTVGEVLAACENEIEPLTPDIEKIAVAVRTAAAPTPGAEGGSSAGGDAQLVPSEQKQQVRRQEICMKATDSPEHSPRALNSAQSGDKSVQDVGTLVGEGELGEGVG